MTPIEAARREWPALEWVDEGDGLWGWGSTTLAAWVIRFQDGSRSVYNGSSYHDCTRHGLTAALRSARYALPAHVEHVPRTPLAVARQDWPALRWTVARAPGFIRLRGVDRRGWHVVTASKWVGEGWRITSEGVAWHHAASLRDGLRRLRLAMP